MARKLEIFAGILTFFITFIYKFTIPFINYTISITIFTFNEVDYCFWGQKATGNEAITSITLQPPENIVALVIFLIIILIGLISIMASTNKSIVKNSLKLYRINILLIILILFIYGWNIVLVNLDNLIGVFIPFLSVLGLGYYILILILILNILAFKKLKKSLID